MRSRYELIDRQDYSMAIILSAMAFECDLSRLYFKYEAAGASGHELSSEELEEKLRHLATIENKILAVCKLLDPRGIDSFVETHATLRARVNENFKGYGMNVGTLAQDFKRKLFRPRNRILHNGYTSFGIDVATRCHEIAGLGLVILYEMEHAREKNGA